MRCLHALGEWGPLCQLVREKWRSRQLEDADLRAEVAKLAAAAAWNLRLWDEMEHYCTSIPKDEFHSNFFRAILSIHGNDYIVSEWDSNHVHTLTCTPPPPPPPPPAHPRSTSRFQSISIHIDSDHIVARRLLKASLGLSCRTPESNAIPVSDRSRHHAKQLSSLIILTTILCVTLTPHTTQPDCASNSLTWPLWSRTPEANLLPRSVFNHHQRVAPSKPS